MSQTETKTQTQTKSQVVTRFPPEPSGYLHLGHLKAIYGNLLTAKKKKGHTILRFDDTNPTTCHQEYVDDIIKVLRDLDLYDRFQKVSYASDYFTKLLEHQKNLIEKGLSYFDYSTSVEISALRGEMKPSPYRDRSVQENLDDWDKFLKGDLKEAVLRLKIDYRNGNASLRDPISYRTNLTPHYRTGTTFKVYPTYDYACPVVDSLDGVTLAMRTNEFTDKDKLAKWVFKNLPDLAHVIYKSFSRLQFEYSLLSKRKIRELVENGTVEGWDDPRLDTLVAIKRRGLLASTFETFFTQNGVTNSNNIEEWDRIYSLNRKAIDKISKRITALGSNQWDLEIKNYPDLVNSESILEKEIPWSPKSPVLGVQKILLGNQIRIDHHDAKLIKEGDLVYLLNFCPVKITMIDPDQKIIKADFYDQEFKFSDIPHKISWLRKVEVENFKPVETLYFDYLLTKPTINKDDPVSRFVNKDSKHQLELYLNQNHQGLLEKGTIIQLVRFGYYIVDQVSPLSLIYIKEPADKKQYLLRESF